MITVFQGIDTSGGTSASGVPFTPADTIAATNVQDAVVEALTDARAYADAVAAGLDPKSAVAVATFAPLPGVVSYATPGEINSSAALGVIDSTYTPVVDDRILVKDEVASQYDGIYVVASAAAPFRLVRSADADGTPAGEVSSGMYTVATHGAHAGQAWVLQTQDPIVVGTTPLAFVPFVVLALDVNKLTQSGATNGQTPVWHQAAGEWRASTTKTAAGFDGRLESVLSFDSGSRTLTIAPAGVSYNVYLQNIKLVKSAPATVVVPITSYQANYIYFDVGGTLQTSTSPWDYYSDLVAPVAVLYWTGTIGVISDERHHYQRDRVGTAYDKSCVGTAYASGLGGTFTNTTLSVLPGTIWVQDLEITQVATQTTARLWYRVPTLAMTCTAAQTAPYAAAAGVPQWDNAGTLTNVLLNQHVKNWVYATNDVQTPIAVVVGTVSGTLDTVRAAVVPAVPPGASWKLIYSVVYKNVGGAALYLEATDYRATTQSSIYSTLVTTIPASNVSFLPTDTIAATDAQTAIVEALTDARAYTDSRTSAIGTSKPSVKVVTEWTLPANTVVGDVMTANANGVLPTIDSQTLSVGDRVLVAKEGGAGVAHVNNGWYVVTSMGSAGTPWVLTRASDGVQGQVIPGSTLFVEGGDSGEDSAGLDIVLNRVSTTTSPTDPQWSVLRAGDTMVDCLLCNGNTVAQRVVTADGVLPVTPTVGFRYAALGPGSYARRPQLRVKARVVAKDTSQSGGCWSILETGDIILSVEAAIRIRVCDSPGHINVAPLPGTSYIVLSPTAGTSLFKLVGPAPGSYFTPTNSYRYDPVWQDFRAAGDAMLIWKNTPTDMWLYMDGPPGRYVDAAGLDENNRVVYVQRQKRTAGRRQWILATPGPITVGTTPLLFQPV